MKLTKTFRRAIFSDRVIRDAYDTAFSRVDHVVAMERSISRGVERWEHDSDEEFFAEYRAGFAVARMGKMSGDGTRKLWVDAHVGSMTQISISAPTRAEIVGCMQIFDDAREEFTAPEPLPDVTEPMIFIGHGGSSAWRDLKDHLTDQHGYRVNAYETGARAGHVIRDILDELRSSSDFAILIMTGEDETATQGFRARQNVVHEIGLFQGTLGFSRAIVLREEGTEPFSNLQGVHEIRFRRGNVRETFGDVLATLRREFTL